MKYRIVMEGKLHFIEYRNFWGFYIRFDTSGKVTVEGAEEWLRQYLEAKKVTVVKEFDL